MRLEFNDENIRRASRIVRCNPADLKRALNSSQDQAAKERKSAMIEAAQIVERRARDARLEFKHPQGHALDLAAKAIRRAAEQS